MTCVSYVNKITYDINFSEPVQSTGDLAYSYTDGTGTPTVTSVTPSVDKKSVRVVFDSATAVNKEITVSLPSITDFASNISKPVVTCIKTTCYNGTVTSLQMKLSEAVKGNTVSGITVTGAAVTASVDANAKVVDKFSISQT